jgi:prepilin-type N-terminal cleavage/methylation domain-containing protein
MLPFASLHRTQRRRPSGFTLIELLVVIAIIAVLAGILFPVFAKARASARKTTSLSNLKQIGAALTMYTADYDEHLPNRWPLWNGYKPFFWKVDGGDLPSLLKPYVKNQAVWYSPEDRRSNRGVTSFILNAELAPGWPLSKIARPAEAIYLTDRTDLDVLTIGPDDDPLDEYFWWRPDGRGPDLAAALRGRRRRLSVPRRPRQDAAVRQDVGRRQNEPALPVQVEERRGYHA